MKIYCSLPSTEIISTHHILEAKTAFLNVIRKVRMQIQLRWVGRIGIEESAGQSLAMLFDAGLFEREPG